ncbi:MAG: hypothetical protein M1816_000551 [Peltula sp. TS41687]|nr:MAG: hypothetical protein M1816_000551 [Peltula sp. TS41687]
MITDIPGQHDTEVIHQMTAPTISGQTVILRPDAVGKTTQQYNAFEDQALLKIGTYVRSIGSGILGIFNIHPRNAMTEFISLDDFPGTNTGKDEGEYIIRAHTTGAITPIIKHDSNFPSLLLGLPSGPKGWEILTCYPLQSFSFPSNNDDNDSVSSPSPAIKTHIATLGLLGKLTGSAAILSSEIKLHQQQSSGSSSPSAKPRVRITNSLKALGILGIYISHLGSVSIDDDILVLLLGKVVPRHTVRKSESGKVLEIDLQKAWKEMNLDRGVRRGNQVGEVGNWCVIREWPRIEEQLHHKVHALAPEPPLASNTALKSSCKSILTPLDSPLNHGCNTAPDGIDVALERTYR